MMRAAMLGAIVLGLVACSGGEGDENTPTPVFPSVAGTYNIEATFGGDNPAESYFGGILTLTQASTADEALGGTLRAAGARTRDYSFTVFETSLSLATVTEAGTIQFTVDDGQKQLAFTGSVDGTSIAGRFTVVAGPAVLMGSGPWRAYP